MAVLLEEAFSPDLIEILASSRRKLKRVEFGWFLFQPCLLLHLHKIYRAAVSPSRCGLEASQVALQSQAAEQQPLPWAMLPAAVLCELLCCNSIAVRGGRADCNSGAG